MTWCLLQVCFAGSAPKCFSQHSNHLELNIFTQTKPLQFLSPNRRVSWIHKTSTGSALFTTLPHSLKQVFLRSVMPHLHPQTFRSHSTCGWSVTLCKHVWFTGNSFTQEQPKEAHFLPGFGEELLPIWSTCSLFHAFPFFRGNMCFHSCLHGNSELAVHHVPSFNMEICISEHRVIKTQAGIRKAGLVSSGSFVTTRKVPVG